MHRTANNAQDPRTHDERSALALGPKAADAITPHHTELRTRDPLRVLLVEDSALLVQRISELVSALPYVSLQGTVNSEAAALERLDVGDIDAVILDLQLHTGSGFGVLKAIRKRMARPSVIVFTNFAIAAYRDSALALGAAHFLDKSRDYDLLPSVLQELSETAH